MTHRVMFFGLIMILGVSVGATAQATEPTPTRKIGIGFVSAPFPVFGLGATYNVNDRVGLQGIGQYNIDVDFLAARGLYRFNRKPWYNVYASGLIGYFHDGDVVEHILGPSHSDTASGFGLGGGFEYFFRRLPEVGWSLEVDYIRIAFDDRWWDYDYKTPSFVMLGLSIQYFF